MNKAKLSRLEKKFSQLYAKGDEDLCKKTFGIELEKMTDEQLEAARDYYIEKMIIEDMRKRPEWYEDLLSK